jgi:hypothetical protein
MHIFLHSHLHPFIVEPRASYSSLRIGLYRRPYRKGVRSLSLRPINTSSVCPSDKTARGESPLAQILYRRLFHHRVSRWPSHRLRDRRYRCRPKTSRTIFGIVVTQRNGRQLRPLVRRCLPKMRQPVSGIGSRACRRVLF